MVAELQTGIGPATVRIPKIRAGSGEPVTFRSVLMPAMCARHGHWERRCRVHILKLTASLSVKTKEFARDGNDVMFL